MTELTEQQIERQDFVDNRIFELINSLLPTSRQIEWDIELIGSIRNHIYREMTDISGVMDEAGFYPFIKI